MWLSLQGKSLYRMWFIVFLLMSSQTPVSGSLNGRTPCTHDVVCGKGDCWEGICEADGYCQAYWTCV